MTSMLEYNGYSGSVAYSGPDEGFTAGWNSSAIW